MQFHTFFKPQIFSSISVTLHIRALICNGTALTLFPGRYVDETEVVLSLKKADDELEWPDLIEAWQSLAKGVSALLKGTSVYVVGESTEINWAVAQDVAAGLEYFLVTSFMKPFLLTLYIETLSSWLAQCGNSFLMQVCCARQVCSSANPTVD